MRDKLRRWPAAARVRLLRLNVIARMDARDGLSRLAEDPAWRATLEAAQSGPRVLIATNTGGHFAIEAIDRLLGAALTVRGAAVTRVLCDAALPACQMCEFNLTPDVGALARNGPDPLLCGYCYPPAEARIQALGLDVRRLGAALSDADRAEAKALAQNASGPDLDYLSWRGVPIGMHALAGALRFFARSDLESEPHGKAILRRYVGASALTAAAYLKLIEEVRPEVVVAHHGIYTPQGLVVAAARAKGIRVVTWNPAYRRHCFIFSHDDSYHYTLMDEPVSHWRDRPLSTAERARTLAYLQSRRSGEGDWIKFHTASSQSTGDVAAQLALDPTRPVIAAYTNVFWDAQLHFPRNAFASQKEWLGRTIAWFAKRPDLQLVIRVHPAEISGSPPSRQLAEDIIAARFSQLPPNVRVVGPESALSSYALAERADAALIFGTKLGVELSAIGIPVIVAGEAWVRGKGFTHDATSPEDYEAKLGQLPFGRRLDPAARELALR
ncbi:MAG TPA: capsular biosynthesis protein, partial [Candidatus Binatia bacterium]|nr:capsular biosynthesis protein [Candidatus Binatia bacterium]